MRWYSIIGGVAAASLLAFGCGKESKPDIALEIASPNAIVYTNGDVTVQVAVTGERPNRVQLLRNGEVLANLTEPYQYLWDTTSDAEGQYELTAQAFKEGKKFETESARIVIVDRTAPQISTRTPEIGAQNVFGRDGFVAHFNEPIEAKSVNEGTVAVTAGWYGPLEVDFDLDPDGLALNIDLFEFPPVPADITIDLGRITDLAGNALSTQTELWTFRMPEWVSMVDGMKTDVYGYVTAARTVFASDGTPFLGYRYYDGVQDRVFVTEGRGKDFELLGNPIAPVNGWSDLVDLALDSQDRPHALVYSYDADLPGNRLQLFRYEGGTWTALGADIQATSYVPYAYSSRLAIDENDTPFVSFTNYDGSKSDYYVMRFNGSAWQILGTPLSYFPETSGNTWTDYGDIAIDSNGQPGVVFTEYDLNSTLTLYAHWNGASWDGPYVFNAYGGSTWAYQPTLVYDGDRAVFAWREYDTTAYNIYVVRQTQTGFWYMPMVSALSGSSSAAYPDIAVTPDHQIFVTWAEWNPALLENQVFLAKEAAGATWTMLETFDEVAGNYTDSYEPRLVFDSFMNPTVTFRETDYYGQDIYVRRYNQ